LAGFGVNIDWYERPKKRIDSYVAPKGCLLRGGEEPGETIKTRRARYADFPKFRGIDMPQWP